MKGRVSKEEERVKIWGYGYWSQSHKARSQTPAVYKLQIGNPDSLLTQTP
jgi:hypothetical protein